MEQGLVRVQTYREAFACYEEKEYQRLVRSCFCSCREIQSEYKKGIIDGHMVKMKMLQEQASCCPTSVQQAS